MSEIATSAAGSKALQALSKGLLSLTYKDMIVFAGTLRKLDQTVQAGVDGSAMEYADLLVATARSFLPAGEDVSAAQEMPTVVPQADTWSLYLEGVSVNGSKIPTIKAIRAITGLPLKEAKDLVESRMPALIKSGMNSAQRRTAAEQMNLSGAVYEFRKDEDGSW